MNTWILVFWLHFPENYTEYTKYEKEKECRDAEYAWQRRLNAVGSKIVAECRKWHI